MALECSRFQGAGCLSDVNSAAVDTIDYVYDSSFAFFALRVFWFLKK